MYTLVKTYGLPSGAGTAWTEIDGTESALNVLFQQYQALKIQVLESFSKEQQILDLYKWESSLRERPIGIDDWLAEQSSANANLRGVKGELSLRVTSLFAYDAVSVDFLPSLSNSRYHPTNQIPLDEKTDIRLTRANTDYKAFGDNCLFTVGGYVHMHEAGNPVGIYIKNAVTAVNKNVNPEIGIVDFSRLGTIKCLPNKVDNLIDPTGLLPWSDEVWLKLPKKVEADETVLLVIGGYLHMLDNAYDILSADTARINIHRLPMLQRYFASSNFLDLSSLGVEINPQLETGNIWNHELLAKPSLQAWLMHSTSFWVYLKAKSVIRKTIDLPNTGLPGYYFLGEQPVGVLREDLGQLPSFIQTYERPLWVLKTQGGLRRNLLLDTAEYTSFRNKIINDTPYLRKPNLDSRAELLVLEKHELVQK